MKPKQAGNRERVWMSRSEVALVLEVAPVTVGRWAAQGKLPYSVTLGGRRRFRREDILAIVQHLAQVPATPVTRKSRRSR